MARRKKGDHISGWINLDKPYGMTSTQAIGKVRRILNAQKIGHAGTLDPLATGVLPIALGEATKTIAFAQDDIKTYHFTITWGESRDTDDMEGKIIATSDLRPSHDDIAALLPKYTGNIQQTPPIYSAIKINGERAYDIARDGNIPEMKPREVYIASLEIAPLAYHPLPNPNPNPQGGGMRGVGEVKTEPYTKLGGGAEMDNTDFIMICGKGTYVRSIARDMGNDLGCKGYISALRREKVGTFTTKNAISLDILESLDYISARSEYLLPLQIVLDDIPALNLKREETARIRNGQVLEFVSRPDFERLTNIGLGSKTSIIALATHEDAPVALIENTRAVIKPVRVFNM